MRLAGETRYGTLQKILRKAMTKDPGVLRSLRILKLQSDMAVDLWSKVLGGKNGHRTPDRLSIQEVEVQWDACPALFAARNLSGLEVMGHSLRGLTVPMHIKSLSLSGFYRRNIATIFLVHTPSGHLCPPAALETLILHQFPQDYGNGEDSAVHVVSVDMEVVTFTPRVYSMYEYLIWVTRGSLKSLDLQTMGRSVAMDGWWRDGHGILCLPEMSKLEMLTIELGPLLAAPQLCEMTRLVDILPPSLEDLVLIERWRPNRGHPACEEDCHVSGDWLKYARGFLAMLNEFAWQQPTSLPRLRRLTLVCHRAWRVASLPGEQKGPTDADRAALSTQTGSGLNHRDVDQEDPDCNFGHFDDASKIFARNGVVFDVVLLERGTYYTRDQKG